MRKQYITFPCHIFYIFFSFNKVLVIGRFSLSLLQTFINYILHTKDYKLASFAYDHF